MKLWGQVRLQVRTAELIGATLLLLLSLGAFVVAWGMPDGSLSAPGPGVFPLGLSGALGIVSLGLMIRAIGLSQVRDSDETLVTIGHQQIWITIAALIGFALIFEWAGYLLSATLFLSILLTSFSTLSRTKVFFAAALGAILSWLFFAKLLGVNLPRGFFENF